MFSYDIKAKGEYLNSGIAISLVIHLLFLSYLFQNNDYTNKKLPPKQVYSLSLEGGKKIGGISQLPDPKKKKQAIAPPKKTVAPKAEPKVESKKEEVVIKKPEVKPEIKPEPEKEIKPESKPEAKPETPKKEIKKIEPKKETKAPPKEKKPNLEEALQKYLGESSKSTGTGFGAATLGGKKQGGGVVKSAAWLRYESQFQRAVKKNWTWHDSAARLEAAIELKITESGEITSTKVIEPSGNPKFDDSIIRAVRKSSPLPKAPSPEIYQDFKYVVIDFKSSEI